MGPWPKDVQLRQVLVGHRAAVNVVDFDDKYIVSASGDRTIKVSNLIIFIFRLLCLILLNFSYLRLSTCLIDFQIIIGLGYGYMCLRAYIDRSSSRYCLFTIS